jgi:hypothetical protein
MTTRERINELLAIPMDRAGFLRLSAGLIIAAIGLTRFLALLNKTKEHSSHDDSMAGYGGTSYGE